MGTYIRFGVHGRPALGTSTSKRGVHGAGLKEIKPWGPGAPGNTSDFIRVSNKRKKTGWSLVYRERRDLPLGALVQKQPVSVYTQVAVSAYYKYSSLKQGSTLD